MITRRQFNLSMAGATLALPFSDVLAHVGSTSRMPLAEASEILSGNFTPFGYLDNPYHTWNLHPSGVFRSLSGIGFGLHFPAGPGGYFDYGKNAIYHAFLRVGFSIGSRLLWAPEDFREGELFASHHSKNLLTYQIHVEGLRASCSFFQVGEDVLAARTQFEQFSPGSGPVRLIAAHEHQLGGASWWGGDGVAAAYAASEDALITHSFSAGNVFAVAADAASQGHAIAAGADWTPALLNPEKATEQATAYGEAPARTVLIYDITPTVAADGITVFMARGANRSDAITNFRKARKSWKAALGSKLDEDASFWAKAPRLTGDWPLHWKNGWVYDFETLRMMVRRPIGIYAHPWDAMQIQVPRSVLAETSIDMWALSYADPETAKNVFLGQFLDAIAPNVPCAREDGTTNMVAADGSECGTSISWCYPFYCAESIYDRTGDHAWLAAIYPRLVEFVRWTLENRCDKDGFVVAKCSWESGMDGSKRFLIEEPTGGEVAEFARLVELQAATAQAAAILSKFASHLGKSEEQQKWARIHQTYVAKTQQMWNGKDWFLDNDARTNTAITSVDVAQVAPIFCGIATREQTTKMVSTMRAFYEASRDKTGSEHGDPSLWSSLMLPYIESLWTAREFEVLAEAVHLIADRIYASMDRRSISNKSGHRLGWPGVSCEVWGREGARGGECYGWGAVMPAHILRNILGIRETPHPDNLFISPNLPKAWMTKGGTYAIENLDLCSRQFSVQYVVTGPDTVEASGRWAAGEIHVEDESGSPITRAMNQFSFPARNHAVYRLRVIPKQRSSK